MTDKSKPRRLSDVVIPGKDYADKKEIKDILDKEVLILSIAKAEGAPEFAKVDPDTGEIINRDYWNVEIEVNDLVYTFSTGAVPIDKKLTALLDKIENGLAELPLLATFRKQGRTYIVE